MDGKYNHGEPTRQIETKIAPNGMQYGESCSKPKNVGVITELRKQAQLPGLVIFVHGVNSEGEWYEDAEKYLCNGLNERLNLTGTNFKLIPNKYEKDGVFPTKFIDENDGRSPVIRFYWGYSAEPGTEREYKIPLRNKAGDSYWDLSPEQLKTVKGPFFWGGGPFQNGCTALNSLWGSEGFSKWILKIPIPFSTQIMNEEYDRLITTAPPRRYYSHAAQRLAALIKEIRTLSPKDTVTIVSHSQGTMIALAASAIEAPDALMVMNSPYCMDWKLIELDTYPHSEWITSRARQQTFANIVHKIHENKDRLKNANHEQLVCGLAADHDSWSPTGKTSNPEVAERDNHGRTYIYCSPHDRVMGSSPLRSIGWQGLPNIINNGQITPHPVFALVPEGSLFVRMLARNMESGGPPNDLTPFGTLPDMRHDWKDANGIPQPPKVFWDSNNSKFSELAWPAPKTNQTLRINGEAVPVPVTALQLKDFDKDRPLIENLNTEMKEAGVTGSQWGYGFGQINPKTGRPNDLTYKYYISLYDGLDTKMVRVITPDKASGLLASDNPNVREAEMAKEKVIIEPASAIPQPANKEHFSTRKETTREMRNRLYHYISRPADHSDLPQNEYFISQVMAYDLPIGYCNIGDNPGWMERLRRAADWTNIGTDFYLDSGTFISVPMPDIILKETSVADLRTPGPKTQEKKA